MRPFVLALRRSVRIAAALAFLHVPALAAQPTAPQALPPDDLTRPRLQATRTTAPISLDGRLDEPDWQRAAAAEAFAQVSPDYAAAAAARTVVRVLFDDQHLYFAAVLSDSLGRRGVRTRDLRREFTPADNDYFAVVLGPLGDRRSAYQFAVTPYGSLRDEQAFDGGDATNENWDALWSARTQRTDSGWIAEIAIPWATLRYDASLDDWDVNFVRNARRQFETSAWSAFPRQLSAYRLTFAGALTGLAPPPPRTNVRLRPYALTDASRRPGDARIGRPSGTGGGELIWAPNANSLVELTANTDFAQAEVDRQVVNLERFSVFFPERRQFFLENTDVLSPRGLTGRYVVQPFFSRRIGLSEDGTPRRLDGGGRYTWRSGRASVGGLALHEGGDGTTTSSSIALLRGSRFVGTASRLGAFAAVQHDGGLDGSAGSTNLVTAVDGLTRIGEQVQLNGMLSTSTEGDRTSLAATYFVGRDTPRLYTGVLGAWVSEDYAPRTGFVSRSNVWLTSPAIVGTMQPTWRHKSVVWFRPALVGYVYQTPNTGALQEGFVQAYVDVLHKNGTIWYPYVERHAQRPTSPVSLLPSVDIAPGRLDYWRSGLFLSTDQSARTNLRINAATGDFFDGTLTRVTSTLRYAPDPRVSLAVDIDVSQLGRIGVRDTSLTTTLVAPEVRLALNPRLLFTSFYQYNSGARTGTLNARFSWEFTPLSFLYVVWNDRRAVANGVLPTTETLVVKLVWLRQL
jgi:hypothetical protein